MPLETILFDWSGTLFHELDRVIKAENLFFQQIGVLDKVLAAQNKYFASQGQFDKFGTTYMTKEFFRAEFELPYKNWYARFTDLTLDEINTGFFDHYNSLTGLDFIIPETEPLIKAIRTRNIPIYIFSAQFQNIIEMELNCLNLADKFKAVYGDCFNKLEHVEKITKSEKLIPAFTMYVGDMVHDIETALEGGMISVAASNPQYSYNIWGKLFEANPHYMVEDIKDLIHLINLLKQWPITKLMPHETNEKRPIIIPKNSTYKQLIAKCVI